MILKEVVTMFIGKEKPEAFILIYFPDGSIVMKDIRKIDFTRFGNEQSIRRVTQYTILKNRDDCQYGNELMNHCSIYEYNLTVACKGKVLFCNNQSYKYTEYEY